MAWEDEELLNNIYTQIESRIKKKVMGNLGAKCFLGHPVYI